MGQTCTCTSQAYWSEFGNDLCHCFGCGNTWKVEAGALGSGRMVVDRPESAASEPFALPPESRALRSTDWLERWPSVTPETVKQYRWYVAEINGFEYLVMPITRKGKAVCYAARALSEGAPKKYHYQQGIKREYWLSEDQLIRDPIFICEGAADAAALAPYGSSVGLLGGFYDGRINDLLKDRMVIVAFDGDFAGHCLALQVATKIAGFCSVSVRSYQGKDPTEWSRAEIEGAM